MVAIELPSHGANDGHFVTLPMMAYAVLDLGHRLQPRLVIAHSLGVGAALSVAALLAQF